MTNNLIANQEVITLPGGNIQTVSFFEGYPVRMIILMPSKEKFVVGKDLGTPLGYADIKQAIRLRVDEEDKGTYSVLPLKNIKRGGGLQHAVCVNRSGLNDLLLDSRKPKAKKIRHFLTKDVMTEIADTGEFKKRDHNEINDIMQSMFDTPIEVNHEPEQQKLSLKEPTDLEALLKMANAAKENGYIAVYQSLMCQAFIEAKGHSHKVAKEN